MKYFVLFAAILFTINLPAQAPPARVSTPQHIVVDSKDNVFVSLKYGIIKITPDGTVTNLTKQSTGIGDLDRSWGNLIIDSRDKIAAAIGNNFITDSYYKNDPAKKYVKYAAHYSVIRKISPGGIVSTLKTPDGKYVVPNDISGMTMDGEGNIIYAASGFARLVGKIDVMRGVFSSVAGQPYKREWCPVYTQGNSSMAEFVSPENIIANNKGEILFADERIHRIIQIAGGKVSTLAGNNIIDPCSQNIGGRAQEGYKDGRALTALFNFPKGMAYDSKGNLFIADMNNHCIRKLSPDGIVTTFAK